ncbi:MAG: ankyrin repeat domain-containing protein [Pseudomonadota bacterium]
MNAEQFRLQIESGQLQDLQQALASNPDLANQTITWFVNQENESDPLHYVCDCVFNGWLSEDLATEIAAMLLEHGARVDGSDNRESPLIGAASLGVEGVAALLVDAGASLEATSIFGARPLHWAAAIGLPQTVAILIERGAELEARCTEFDATPLYWAAHAMGQQGPSKKKDPLAAAKILIEAGADPHATNKAGVSVLECSSRAESKELYLLLRSYSK